MERDRDQDHSGGINPDKDLSDRFCTRPFVHAEIHLKGEIYPCCPAWVDRPIGNFRDGSLQEAWSSPEARAVRESILDGSFRHCQRKWCPDIQGDRLPKISELDPHWKGVYERRETVAGPLPRTIVLCYDETCNLSCPSCRTQKIGYPVGSAEHTRSLAYTERLMGEINAHPGAPVNLHVAGLGDPFAAPVFRHLLEGFDGAKLPHLTLDLKTNGVMLTPRTWERIRRVHGNINSIMVSIDASTRETYEVVRRNGDWDLLLDNLRALVRTRRDQGLRFVLNGWFVVQRANYREVASFARFFTELGFDEIHYLLVDNFGTWGSTENYERQCVWRSSHGDFDGFMEVLRDPILGERHVYLGGLSEYRRRALASTPRRSLDTPRIGLVAPNPG